MNGRVQKAARWATLVRNGMSPVSLVRRKVLGDWRLRFRGVDVATDDLPSAWDVAMPVWGGEYDEPGYVPARGETVVDIGGNIGLFAMLAASRGAKVTSYEPHPRSFEFLRRNTDRWGVECHQAAVVGEARESVRLFVHPQRSSRNTTTGVEIGSAVALEESVDAPAVALAQVLARPCDLLKIDCEGAEFEILRADRNVLRQARRIIGEVHTAVGDADDLANVVRAAGFDATLKRSSADELHSDEQPFLMLLATRR